ncbi:MAG: c-type cytochrome [Nitrospinae bacterium]|nr:c-type cytochrome [Nitrospinota bacterium]
MGVKTVLKAIGAAMLILLLIDVVAVFWAMDQVEKKMAHKFQFPPLNISEKMKTADRETGRRIVMIRNRCPECHGEDLGGKTFMKGAALGTFSGGNITPYELGKKSDEDVARAVYYGIRPDGTPLIFMPSVEYHNLALEDVAAVVAYLRGVPAVARPNGEIRIALAGKLFSVAGKAPMIFSAEMISPSAVPVVKPPEVISVAFGKYLVVSSCAGCHGERLEGGTIEGGDPSWPPASNLRTEKLGAWREEDFIKAMRTGLTPEMKITREPMLGLIEYGKQMNDMELRAMWSYLSTL